MLKKIRIAVTVLKSEGPIVLVHRVRRFVSKRVFGWNNIVLSVGLNDVKQIDLSRIRKIASSPKLVASQVLTVHWVLPPAGIGSGGHMNIFRFVRFLEEAGHKCKVFYYDPNNHHTQAEADAIIKHFPAMESEVSVGLDGVEDCDALFATSWQTAYPVFNVETVAKKFYFVQDFEPAFYPVSSESVLADNTYKFGFYGITAGKWLTQKLSTEYDMSCDYYEFATDNSHYKNRENKERKSIFFYARPVTPRRGFELGVMALELFHEHHPEYEIQFAGWDVGEYKFSFPFVNHGVLKLDALDAIYNECSAALVVSLTNMSLLPLELLSTGCIPVVNDAPNNRLVSNNPFISYAEPTPLAMSDALCEVVERDDIAAHADLASKSVGHMSWDDSGAAFLKILLRELHG